MMRIGSKLPWLLAAVILLVLPFVISSGAGLSLLNMMGISIIFALSYNMMLGQTGLLSFGHAVYFGLGAYFSVHFMNWIIAARAPIPLPLVPLAGGLAGLFFAALFGWVSTRRAGTTFSMISLGLAELVGSSALILRTFFGGEEGITTDRTKLLRLMDWNFGSQFQMYFLIAGWCLVSAAAMYALTRTPFGRMCLAVRENPERVQFVGYNPQIVRYIAFCLSGFFAGVAGALNAINFEIANAALFGAGQSGTVLLATFIGGAGTFIGPVFGAVLVSYLQVMLSDVTEVWQLYFGLLFIAVVLFAPGGLAGLALLHTPVIRERQFVRLLPSYSMALVSGLLLFLGLVLIIEMIVQLNVHHAEGPAMRLFGVPFRANSLLPWGVGLALLAVGGGLMRRAIPHVGAAWEAASAGARARGALS